MRCDLELERILPGKAGECFNACVGDNLHTGSDIITRPAAETETNLGGREGRTVFRQTEIQAEIIIEGQSGRHSGSDTESEINVIHITTLDSVAGSHKSVSCGKGHIAGLPGVVDTHIQAVREIVAGETSIKTAVRPCITV